MAGRLGDLDGDDLLKAAFLLAALVLAYGFASSVGAAFTRSPRPILFVVLVLVLLWYYDRI